MKIAFAASEVFPYAKTGGLADVAGALPIELSKLGHEVKVFMPKYNTFGEIEHGLHSQWDIGEIPIRVAGAVCSVHVHSATLPGSNVQIYFVDCPQYFHRFRVYTNDADEDERFILFSKGIIEILQRLQWAPDIIHCNDWQTGCCPYFSKRIILGTKCLIILQQFSQFIMLLTQGRFPKSAFYKAEIREIHSQKGGLGEYEGDVNF